MELELSGAYAAANGEIDSCGCIPDPLVAEDVVKAALPHIIEALAKKAEAENEDLYGDTYRVVQWLRAEAKQARNG